MSLALSKLKRRPLLEDQSSKPKKKINRFDGLTEEEVQKYTLEDILEPALDLVFVGINPSLMAAHRGRYYAGPGNHFYKLLSESHLVPQFVSFEEDHKLLNHKIGLTNIVARATRSSADLKKPEIKEGAAIVREKLKIFKPLVAVFNGKCIYEVFANKNAKSEFYFGLQPERVGETAIWVVPSSSARCAHFPRMVDKLHFYTGLKKYLSFLKGDITEVNHAEFRFEGKCKQSVPSTSKMWRRKNVSAFLHGGRIANQDTFRLDTSEEDLAVVNSTEFIVTEIFEPYSKSANIDVVGSESVEIDNNEVEDSAKTISSTDRTSQEIKSEENNLPSVSESPKKEKKLKRCWKRSPVSQASSRTFKVGESMDFMNMIKQRLSEKKERMENENKVVEITSQPIKEVKKLKYANLKSNIKKQSFSVKNESTERCTLDDLDNSVCSD